MVLHSILYYTRSHLTPGGCLSIKMHKQKTQIILHDHAYIHQHLYNSILEMIANLIRKCDCGAVL